MNENMGASQATGLGSSKEPEPHSGLGPTGAIPSAERRRIAAFLSWWAKDQARMAETTNDLDKEIEFSIRAEALADAARDILDFGDVRHNELGI